MTTKIAYIMSRFPGLSETFILREMNALREMGWDIELFPIIVQDDEVVHDSVDIWMKEVHRLPWISTDLIIKNVALFFKTPVLYLSTLFQILWENKSSLNFLIRSILIFPKSVYASALMLSGQIQHIHAHYSTHPALMAWIIHRFTGISYSVTVHAHDIFVRRAMLSAKMKDASFIIAISEFNREFLAKHLGNTILEKIHVIHCGIEPDKYLGEKFNSRSEKINLISVGGLRPYKGMSYLIDACVLLAKKGIPFHCVVVGEGPERSALEDQIARLDMKDWVTLAGAKTQDEVADLLKDADCYVQPSVITPSGKMEGIPVALMEAMASGLPVVASNLSGIPELVIDGKTGYLVPERNPQALADAIEKIYLNHAEADSIAVAGQLHVQKEFSLRSNVNQISSLFTKAVR